MSAAPELSIGVIDGPGEYVLDRVAGARLLDGRRIAIADGGSNTVRIYGADGSLERQWGREGVGPGDFQYISGLFLHPPDTLVVYDSGQARLSRFDVAGEVLGTVTFRVDDGRVEVYLGRFRDGTHAAAWIRQYDRDWNRLTPDSMGIARFSPEGAVDRVLGHDVGMRRLGGPTPFSPHFIGAVLGDSVYHTDGLEGRLRVTSVTGSVEPDLDARVGVATPREAWASLEASLDTATFRRVSELRGDPALDSVPRLSEMLVDFDGLIWLKRYNAGTDTHWIGRQRTGGEWRVILPDGEPVADVTLPPTLRLLDARGDRIVGVVQDELGVERVEVYRIQR